MKKINKIVVCLIVTLLLCLIASCDNSFDNSCTHEAKEVIEEVKSTCISNGYAKYRCLSCGEVFTETKTEVIHNYITAHVDKATCQSYGYTIEECTLCKKQIKVTGSEYGTHFYNQNHICQYCNKQDPTTPCFTITPRNIMPYRADYYNSSGSKIWSSVKILSVEPAFDGTQWYVQLTLQKTYDHDGYTGTSMAIFYYEIRNSNDEIVYRDTPSFHRKYVGDTWTYKAKNLEPGNYTIRFMDPAN